MPEPLAFKTPERIRDEDSDVFTEPSNDQSLWQLGRHECEHQEVGVLPRAVTESRDATHVTHPVPVQVSQDLGLRHVAKFGSEDRAFGCVPGSVKTDGDLFLTERGCLEKSFCLGSSFCFYNQSTVCWSFDLEVISSANRMDLLCGPENVHLPEGDILIARLHYEE